MHHIDVLTLADVAGIEAHQEPELALRLVLIDQRESEAHASV